uniref:Uncharacterized protein n=1 Tax=Sipha flava TaxID=143950 RepID=A0A2S2R873_9HEMI
MCACSRTIFVCVCVCVCVYTYIFILYRTAMYNVYSSVSVQYRVFRIHTDRTGEEHRRTGAKEKERERRGFVREEGRSSGYVAGSRPFYVYVYRKGQDPAAATTPRATREMD